MPTSASAAKIRPCCERGRRRRARRIAFRSCRSWRSPCGLWFAVDWREAKGEDRAPAGARSPFRKCASGRRGAVERGAGGLVVGEEGRAGRLTRCRSRRLRRRRRRCGRCRRRRDAAEHAAAAVRHRPCRAAATPRRCRAPPGSSPMQLVLLCRVEGRFAAPRRAPASCRRRGRAPSARRGFRGRLSRPCAFFARPQ